MLHEGTGLAHPSNFSLQLLDAQLKVVLPVIPAGLTPGGLLYDLMHLLVNFNEKAQVLKLAVEFGPVVPQGRHLLLGNQFVLAGEKIGGCLGIFESEFPLLDDSCDLTVVMRALHGGFDLCFKLTDDFDEGGGHVLVGVEEFANVS